jgi:hypothetical protein
MVYLTRKLNQKPIMLTFGRFDHLLILDKSFWTCPTWLVVFWLTIKWSFWLFKLDKKLGIQEKIIKKSICEYKNVNIKLKISTYPQLT